MTAFDAHLQSRTGGSAWSMAGTMIRGRPGVMFVSILAAATIVCLAFIALVAGQEARLRVAGIVDGVQASVFLRPQVSRGAAEALKAQLETLPFVRDAVLHTKEAAIAALETSGLPQTASRSNPLPDVWVVTLTLGRSEPAKSLVVRASEARTALSQLPDVETVDLDAAWLATLERWQTLAATGSRVGLAVGFPVVWLLLVCLFYLTGRAVAARTEQNGRTGGGAVIVGIVLGVAALVMATAFVAVIAYSMQTTGLEWKPIAVRIGQMGECVTVLCVSTIVLSVATFWASGRR